MCVDVDKYHKLIRQTGDPVILLNVTNNTLRLVSFMVEMLELKAVTKGEVVYVAWWRFGTGCRYILT